jgi:hypothetical protein
MCLHGRTRVEKIILLRPTPKPPCTVETGHRIGGWHSDAWRLEQQRAITAGPIQIRVDLIAKVNESQYRAILGLLDFSNQLLPLDTTFGCKADFPFFATKGGKKEIISGITIEVLVVKSGFVTLKLIFPDELTFSKGHYWQRGCRPVILDC